MRLIVKENYIAIEAESYQDNVYLERFRDNTSVFHEKEYFPRNNFRAEVLTVSLPVKKKYKET